MLRRACLALAVVLTSLGAGPVAQQQQLDTRFGIAESLASPSAMADIGAGWTRVLLAWHHIQSNNPYDYWGFGRVLREPVLDAEVGRGVRVAAVVQYTPSWAATDPAHGHRAVPRNLFLAYDDPDNYFGQFVYQTVLRYAGRIDEWIIWNEPDFRAADPGVGEAYTWQGTEQEFAQLLKVGYLAAKRANPRAVVSFPATSYWADVVAGRTQYYERVLDLLSRDEEARVHNLYHDAVAVNLYRKADDVYRVHGVFKEIQWRHGVDRPIWLTETNAMPSDDRTVPCWERHTGDPWQTTQYEQAAFAVQTFALAAAAGYQHIAWWRMLDGRACIQERLWGAVRDDGTWRPAAQALKTAVTYFSGSISAQFVPLESNGTTRVYQVIFTRPAAQRVTVLWTADAAPVTVSVARTGAVARAVDMFGHEQALVTGRDGWLVDLGGATAAYQGDHYIGGPPTLLIEDGVDPSTGIAPPAVVGAG
jgi:hypothetical protein